MTSGTVDVEWHGRGMTSGAVVAMAAHVEWRKNTKHEYHTVAADVDIRQSTIILCAMT